MSTTPNSIITPQAANLGALNVVLSTAMTSTNAFDGTMAVGTSMALLYTVGANGGTLPVLRAKYSGTNGTAPSGASNATVLRLFINNGAANTTPANNTFFDEVNVPSASMSINSSVAALTYDFGKLALPAGTKIYGGLGTAMGGTNCALAVSMVGGGDF